MRSFFVSVFVLALTLTSASVSAARCQAGNFTILVYGQANSVFTNWLQTDIQGASVTHDATTANILSLQFLSQFDLVIAAGMNTRYLSLAESAASKSYLEQGGAIVALASFSGSDVDREYQQPIFSALGVSYSSYLVDPINANYNPSNPLTAGVMDGYVTFFGGWLSTPYQGPGSTSLFLYGGSSVGQTIVLPSGGWIIIWGDEHVLNAANFGLTGNRASRFWQNAVTWANSSCQASPLPCNSTSNSSIPASSSSNSSTPNDCSCPAPVPCNATSNSTAPRDCLDKGAAASCDESVNTAAIAGGVVGGFCGIALFVAAGCMCRKVNRTGSKPRQDATAIGSSAPAYAAAPALVAVSAPSWYPGYPPPGPPRSASGDGNSGVTGSRSTDFDLRVA